MKTVLNGSGQLRFSFGVDGMEDDGPDLDMAFIGPAQPYGPGVGDLDYWRARLLEMEKGVPSYLNGVPVKALLCAPLRWEVTRYLLTAESGLGTGCGLPRVDLMCLTEAAVRVQSGSCPEWRLVKGSSNRWVDRSRV